MKTRFSLGLLSFFSFFLFFSSYAYAETITIACGAVGDEFDICRKNAESWAKKTGNKVELFQSPNLTNDRLGLFQQFFAAKSSEIDVVQIDVIWPGLLGKHFVDLNKYIPRAHSEQHFAAILDNNTSPKGELLAIPFFTDAGLLFYRKDLLDKHGYQAPQTWVELKNIAAAILAKERPNNAKMVGFVWQGKAYEGLTCDALEWIDSYGGGSIIDSSNGKITVNNPNAVKALEMAASWIKEGISPRGVLNYGEEEARGVFQSGNAIFMRNWPYAWNLGQSKGSPIRGKIGVVPLPKGETATSKHTGTLGGWNLAVSKYSKNAELAADLVKHMTTPEIQFYRAIVGSYQPTIAAVYKEAKLEDINPFQVQLLGTFTNAVARPSKFTGRKYNRVSNKFWNAVHSVLSGEETAEEALAQLEKDINRIKGRRW